MLSFTHQRSSRPAREWAPEGFPGSRITRPSPVTASSLVSGILLGALVLWCLACGQADDRVVVDFSKTLPVARPGDQGGRPQQPSALRVAVAAMVSPKETFDLYRQLLAYLGRRLGQDLKIVQRKTYGEINDLLEKGEVDLAFICSGPYSLGRTRHGFEPLAVPEVQGSHFYRSYLIVNQNSPFQRLEDLRGRTFALTDPESNTGALVPTYWLAGLKESPQTFFSRTIYTYSHDNSIMAVARGLVDGAAVDGLVWEYYSLKNPSLTLRTRIIKKSEPYGIPPLVASRHLPREFKEQLRQMLLSLHQEPEGKRILGELLIDRFLPLREEWYEPIRQMHRSLSG